MTTVTLPDGSIASFPDDMSHDDMAAAIDQHLTEKQAAPSGPVAAAQGWLNIMNGAQQGTSPVVRDNKGNLNYTRLGNPITTDAGPGFVDSEGKWQLMDSMRHVMLTDPATGRAGVFERNKDMDMGPAESLGQVLPLGVLSGAPAVAGALRPAGSGSLLGNIAASPGVQSAANAVTNMATKYGGAALGQFLGLPDLVSGLLGGSFGGDIGGKTLQTLAKWLGSRAPTGPQLNLFSPPIPPASVAPVVNYAAPFSVPGLLGTTDAVAGGGVLNQPPYGYPYSTP